MVYRVAEQVDGRTVYGKTDFLDYTEALRKAFLIEKYTRVKTWVEAFYTPPLGFLIVTEEAMEPLMQCIGSVLIMRGITQAPNGCYRIEGYSDQFTKAPEGTCYQYMVEIGNEVKFTLV